MNKNFSKLLTLTALSLWGSHLMASSVTAPNTFVSGTTASASEVNANFDAVANAVNDNNSNIDLMDMQLQSNVTSIDSINTQLLNIDTGAGPYTEYYPANTFIIGNGWNCYTNGSCSASTVAGNRHQRPLNLPTNSAITEMTCYYSDGNSNLGYDITNLSVSFYEITAGIIGSLTVPNFSLSAATTGSSTNLQSSSVAHSGSGYLVDNSKAYGISANIAVGKVGSTLRFYGCKISYIR